MSIFYKREPFDVNPWWSNARLLRESAAHAKRQDEMEQQARRGLWRGARALVVGAFVAALAVTLLARAFGVDLTP